MLRVMRTSQTQLKSFLEGHNIDFSSWDTDHSCDSLTKNVPGFGLVLKIFLRLN